MDTHNEKKIINVLKHVPLTLKMLLTTVVIGFVAWAILDYFQTRNMKMVFDTHVSDFIPREQYESMSKPVLVTDRQNRALTALFLIFSFSIIGIWITRRIQGLSDRVVTSSKQHLGIELEESTYGDQLNVLEMQFQRLTEEVVLSRDSLLEEKRNLEVTHEEVVIKNWEIDENRKKLQSALDGISSLIQEVSHGKGFEVRSVDHMFGNCYELLSCGKTGCPCYGRKGIKCWEEKGTLCNEDNSEDIADQHESCEKCLVFNETSADPVFQIGEYFNNMMQILESKNKELERAYEELKSTQSKILQQEKMASIGQLAAGVAHEINNPMGFITSNLGTLDKYVEKFIGFIKAQSEVIEAVDSASGFEELKEMRKKLKLDYVMEDVKELIQESLEGSGRVKTIVQNLKSFSRVDEKMYAHADMNECIESTLNIVWNELKYKTTVKKEYGELPLTKCYPQQLNQVFMNLLVNAVQAIEKQGEIAIKTWNGTGTIHISISDTGSGIPKDKLNRIFEPFFTTKEVGKGTGLGLSITYDIVKKHNGDITVESEEGKGTTFTLKIPVVEGR